VALTVVAGDRNLLAVVFPSAPTGDDGPGRVQSPGPPVFVLCNARSGSTLLRFLLDAHPELACPPETNMPAIAGQLATVWSLIEGAPLSSERGDEPPMIPDRAIAGVRRAMDEMMASYLSRRGKQRYCDKSLGTARYAELLLRVYPEAKFLCLYRHPMDVIASGIEACPWGVTGYGFDPYIAGSPGNVVSALARFWVACVGETLAAEEQFPGACHRVRYEDLVADPETVAAEIFEFLGASQQPGISARCLSTERERSGPSDYKIWHTARISDASVGKGWSVPAGLIPPPVAQVLNELGERLGYVPVDEDWGTAALPRDLRTGGGPGRDEPPHEAELPGSGGLAETIRAGLSGIDEKFIQRWGACAGESFLIAAVATGISRRENRWLVDLTSRTIAPASTSDSDDTAWDIVGTLDAWQAVLSGHSNLGVAIVRCELRYCDDGEAGAAPAGARIGMLADLLGIAPAWQTEMRRPAAVTVAAGQAEHALQGP
jgi:hypothetical protein